MWAYWYILGGEGIIMTTSEKIGQVLLIIAIVALLGFVLWCVWGAV